MTMRRAGIVLTIIAIAAWTAASASVIPAPGIPVNPPGWTDTGHVQDDNSVKIVLANGTVVAHCVNWSSDLNKDCTVNPGDQALLASEAGHKPWTVTLTSTPTSTDTPTAVPTATDTPTATPTSSGPALSGLISSLEGTGMHEGTLCSTGYANVSGYGWEFGAADQDPADVSGKTYGTGYGTTQWDCNAGPTSNVTLETRNFRAYALSSSGNYTLVSDSAYWCGVYNQNYSTWASDCSSSTGPNWAIPTTKNFSGVPHPVSLHWAACCDPTGPGRVCSVVVFEARITGSGAGSSYVLVNAGFDWYTSPTSQGYAASFFGKYYHLGGDWEYVYGSSCTASQLSSSPPPGF